MPMSLSFVTPWRGIVGEMFLYLVLKVGATGEKEERETEEGETEEGRDGETERQGDRETGPPGRQGDTRTVLKVGA